MGLAVQGRNFTKKRGPNTLFPAKKITFASLYLTVCMDLSTLTAISPVDGRYRSKADNLAAYFSEYALIRYRVRVEVEYFIALSAFLPQLKELDTPEVKAGLR